jgi:hypothetical protein
MNRARIQDEHNIALVNGDAPRAAVWLDLKSIRVAIEQPMLRESV